MTKHNVEARVHPFADLIGLLIERVEDGKCEASINFKPELLNPNGTLHGGVLYSLADTSMGGALHSVLGKGDACATIEIKITYLRPAFKAKIRCEAKVIKKGRRVAMLEADIFAEGKLVARANGSFAVFKL